MTAAGTAATAARRARRAEASQRADLRVVGPARSRGARRTTTLVVAVLFAVLFAVAGMQAYLVQGQVRLDRLEDGITARTDQLDRLTIELATLATPTRIQGAALEAGLVPPRDLVFLAPASAEPLTGEQITQLDGASGAEDDPA